ncbi:MAG: hypothetical protein Q8Q62_19730 [Mesorhizobium sp.]|nr:hypothetical protein [Mesorhizobium sp.]
MTRIYIAIAALVALSGWSNAASIVNSDAEARTVIVTEGDSQQELSLAAGQAADFCPNGCFVSLEGERETLLGSETVEISGGRMRIR